MENILNSIEGSEENNPVLTAALQEIERLNKIIDQAKGIITCRITSIKEGDQPQYLPTKAQANSEKIEMMATLLFNYDNYAPGQV